MKSIKLLLYSRACYSTRFLCVLYSRLLFFSGPDVALTIEALIVYPLRALLLTLGRRASALKLAYSWKTRPRLVCERVYVLEEEKTEETVAYDDQ